jgi:hypothetical protein
MTLARRQTWAICGCLALSVPALAADPSVECGTDLPLASRQQAIGPGYVVAFAPSRWPLPVGQHFSLNFQLCPQGGQAAPDAVRVDADMPLHKHGMNYRASVKPLGDGRYHADGLMFHMRGRWRVLFDVSSGAQTVRLSCELEVQ